MIYTDADTVPITLTISAYEYMTPYVFHKWFMIGAVSRWRIYIQGKKHPTFLGG